MLINPSTIGDVHINPIPYTESIAKFKSIETTSLQIVIPQGADKVEILNLDWVDDITVNGNAVSAEVGFLFQSTQNLIESKIERSPQFTIDNPKQGKIKITVSYPSTSNVDLNSIT